MKYSLEKLIKKQGLPPGTIIHQEHANLELKDSFQVVYDEHEIEVKRINDKTEVVFDSASKKVIWIDNSNLETKTLLALKDTFKIQPLIQEDIVNNSLLPKFEETEGQLFLIFKWIKFEENQLVFKDFNVLLGGNWVLSFNDTNEDVLEPVRKRLLEKKGKIRQKKSDYLAYAILDLIVDKTFSTIRDIDAHVAKLSVKADENPSQELFKSIQKLKSDVVFLKRYLQYTLDALISFKESDSPYISPNNIKYLKDVDDHLKHLIDITVTLKDESIEIYERFLSNLNFKSNEIMKTLTLIATVFMPLTFIAGIYGMNFKYIPELEYRLGYPIVIVAMLMIAFVLLIFYRKKKWL